MDLVKSKGSQKETGGSSDFVQEAMKVKASPELAFSLMLNKKGYNSVSEAALKSNNNQFSYGFNAGLSPLLSDKEIQAF